MTARSFALGAALLITAGFLIAFARLIDAVTAALIVSPPRLTAFQIMMLRSLPVAVAPIALTIVALRRRVPIEPDRPGA